LCSDRTAAESVAIQRLRRSDILLAFREASALNELVVALYPALFTTKIEERIARVHDLVSDVAAALPCVVHDSFRINERADLTQAERLILIAAGLRRYTEGTTWLHFTAAHTHRQLDLAGVEASRAACLLHASLILLHGPEKHPARQLAHEIIRDLSASSPSDALRSGLQAAALGSPQDLPALVPLAGEIGIAPPEEPHRPDIGWVQSVARTVHSPVASAWPVASLQDAKKLTRVELFPFEQRSQPAPLGDSSHFIFRKPDLIYVPPVDVHVFEGGSITFRLSEGGYTEFYVFDASGSCIGDLSWGTVPFVHDVVHEVEGDLGVLSDQFAGPMNICHFLSDHLTRAHIYGAISGRSGKLLLADGHDYYREILNLAGLTDRTVIPGSNTFSVRAGRLLVSSNLLPAFRHPAHWGAPWATGFVRRRLLRDGATGSRRIFVSRNDAGTRRILNGEEVEQEFRKNGFEIVSLARLSPADQIRIFSNAELVAGLHGAGLTNILFAPPSAKVLEILPPFVATEAYWILATQMGQQYWAMIARDPELPNPDYAHWRHAPEFAGRDVILPIDRLRATLEQFVA
jgi:hypothetical protein